MDDDQQFCLRWNNHQSTLISVFDTLLENETLVDCTLAAEGKFLKAHKVVLSACSPYFATLLQEQYDKHPIFILKDVKYQELRAMMDYMYRGEVNISQDQLAALLKAAESLQIKGLSDNRSGGSSSSAPKLEHHRSLNVPGSSGGKLGGYTLEQTQSKRARVGPSSMETQDMSGSREGSSSPSRRRRKPRRRSIENAMADVHDNSNSSQIQANQASLQQQQSNANIGGVGAITAVTSALASQMPVSAVTLPTGASGTATVGASLASTQGTTQQLTTNVTKKTESVKGTSDAMNTENVQVASGAIGADDQSMEHVKGEKQNHKQKSLTASAAAGSATGKETSELVIEPKSEYDEEGNEETVEDLTLDDEEMGMEDLDQNAGTSQGGEGSSQGYAPWQHDRSQDELLLATQEAQQRDPQDLSITRIAGLTWNEWNARLAMPLVTQLREGVNPLVFPTDLSINAMDKQCSSAASVSGASSTAADRKSPSIITPPNELNVVSNASTKSALNCPASGGGSATAADGSHAVKSGSGSAATTGGGGGGSASKMKHLSEEEATALMLKAAAEKSAAANNLSGNLSDNSFGDEGANANSSAANTSGDYHSALSSAAAFADVSGASGLCNISILSNISALNSLIGGSGSGNGLGSAAAAGGGGSGGGGGTGGGSGGGHPCPECGRVYKLKSSLRNHQKWECGKEPQFQCPFCVYRAKQKMHIGRHMERMHKEKFIKLEDLKSYASGSGDDSSSATAAAAALAASAELRQHFT